MQLCNFVAAAQPVVLNVPFSALRYGTTVRQCLIAALGHAIVANDGSDSQTIISEDALAAGQLRAR
jgi:hypothetical protein